MSEPAEYCDHCGELYKVIDLTAFDEVPWDTDSASKGESAVLCYCCLCAFRGVEK